MKRTMETMTGNVNDKTMLEGDNLRQHLMIEVLKLTPGEARELLTMWKEGKKNGKQSTN